MEERALMPVEQANSEIAEITKKIGTLRTDIMKAVEANGDLLKRCVSAGEVLLERVKSEQMTDQLDDDIATFIDGAKKAYKAMGDNRKPQTQVLDLVKKGFTTMEAMVYAKNPDSVVYKLQVERDKYAAWKLEQQRKAEEERQRLLRIEQEKTALYNETKRVLGVILDEQTMQGVNKMNSMFAYMNLENKDQVRADIFGYADTLDLGTLFVARQPRYSSELAETDAKAIMNNAYKEEVTRIQASYGETIRQTKDELLMKFDSKVAELEEIKRKAEEEQKRLEEERRKAEEERRKAEEERRKAEEAAKAARDEAEKKAAEEAAAAAKKAAEEAERVRLEAEKARQEVEKKAAEEAEKLRLADEQAAKEREEQLKKEAELREQELKLNAASNQAADLFNMAGGVGTRVKAKVTRRIEVLNATGWQEIISAWWTYVGSGLDMEKLESKLGFMKKAVESEINKKDLTIDSKNLAYKEEVAAK